MSGVNSNIIMSGYGMRTLTMKEEKRLEIIQRVFRGELTMGKASLVLGVSERQCYRIKARVKQQGVKGVVHGNRGRACKRKVKEKEVKRIVELAKGKYRGVNDHHLTEKLREQEEIELSREKIRQVLRFHGSYLPERNVRPSIAAEEREKRPRG
jgi:transposase-like protein